MSRVSNALLAWPVAVGGGAALVLVISGALFGESHITQAASSGVAANATLPFTQDGQRITVPVNSPLLARLNVQPVAVRQGSPALTLPAVVEANPARVAKVMTALAGRVLELKVSLGDYVTKGQVLATIDSPDLAQAYDDEAKTLSAATLAEAALTRQRGLMAIDAGSDKDLQAAEDTYRQADADYKRATARLVAIGAPTVPGANGPLAITAPISGMITDLQAAAGTFVNDATQSLMTISDLDTIWVTASVPETDLAFVSKGQAAEITFIAVPGKAFRGTVLFVNDIVDPDTRRTKVRIVLTNPNHEFKLNMFANVTFLGRPRPQIVVPSSALVMNSDATAVFVQTAPRVFERRPVEYVDDTADSVVVTKGLTSGERVVTAGGVFLND